MQQQTLSRQARSPRGKTRFKGIGRFCQQVNREPSHVYRVLIGERPSRLKQLFKDWQREQEAAR